MDAVKRALDGLNRHMTERPRHPPITFEQFLKKLADSPTLMLRNVFQLFHDMIVYYVGTGVDEYPDDPESIHYVNYDCSRLFEKHIDRAFFADRLFANRLVNLVDSMMRGAQQNKIYVFRGPPGSGKSTFLNGLLKKFEAYANTEEGTRYEVLWRIEPEQLGVTSKNEGAGLLEQLSTLLGQDRQAAARLLDEGLVAPGTDGAIEIPCRSHDHPLLVIPKEYRQRFLDELFGGTPFRGTLFSRKEYDWVFNERACTFCSSLYSALLNRLKRPAHVHRMIYARPYTVNRRIGEGITVFTPGDPTPEESALRNPAVQAKLTAMFGGTQEVRYLFSRYAKTNNGVYALMDIKSHNTERLIELHNIISEGTHKVEDIEEDVNSLLIAVMNPEDEKNVKEFRSFSDRIAYINIPYVMDLNTEVKIYRNTFGAHIDDRFLPTVLDNFARLVISTRMNTKSEALLEWIGDPRKYSLYCDDNLQLLKMEIYRGLIPPWLTEEDRKNLTARRRRRIIGESEREGTSGISGRDSINIFSEFYSTYGKQDKLINMSMLHDFFARTKRHLLDVIPQGFLDSLVRMYNFTVLQEVKEAMYFYNEQRISRDILNYIFAVNFEPPSEESCTFTGEKLRITEDFFSTIEVKLLGAEADERQRRTFRSHVQHEYTSRTLTQEILVEDRKIDETTLYEELRDRYVKGLKEKSLDPFLGNDNFRRALKDYGTKDFNTYDKRIREEVRYLLRNLQQKFGYSEQGAREVCIYVVDNELARMFADKDNGGAKETKEKSRSGRRVRVV
jgi:predicted Ser/Thr protein kinase